MVRVHAANFGSLGVLHASTLQAIFCGNHLSPFTRSSPSPLAPSASRAPASPRQTEASSPLSPPYNSRIRACKGGNGYRASASSAPSDLRHGSLDNSPEEQRRQLFRRPLLYAHSGNYSSPNSTSQKIPEALFARFSSIQRNAAVTLGPEGISSWI